MSIRRVAQGAFDVVAALGLFEYVHNVKALLATIHQQARMLVTSYCTRTTEDPDTRLERGFVNDYGLNEFVDLCQGAGWVVKSGRSDGGWTPVLESVGLCDDQLANRNPGSFSLRGHAHVEACATVCCPI